MNNDNSGAIVFLLAAILCVLLFGSSAVLTGLGWVMSVGAVLSITFLIIAGIARFFGAVRSEISTARAKREPWLYLFVLWPSFIGNAVVFGIGALTWMDANIRFMTAVTTVPYWWVPTTMMFASLVVGIMERAHEWLPAVPGVLVKMLRGWLWLAVAPVASPVGRWREIHGQRVRGDQVGAVSAALSLLGALVVGILLWPLGTLVPFGIVMAVITGISR